MSEPTATSAMSPAETPAPGPSLALTFAVISRTRFPALEALVAELVRIGAERDAEVVVGVETPGVTAPAENPDAEGVRWIALPPHRGIAYNRNRVLDAARGAVVIGVDDDCMPKPGWIDALLAPLADPSVAGTVGGIEIPPAGLLGDCISALGFPAGGSAGYATMFRVDPDGTTYNIAAGNCALRADVLRELGGFDESLTYGGEDTELAHRFNCAGKRLVFAPDAVIVHPARKGVGEFVRWSYVRGRAKRQFSRRVAISGYVTARFASYGKILSANAKSPRIVLLAPLLLANLLAQQVGFIAETVRPTRSPRGRMAG